MKRWHFIACIGLGVLFIIGNLYLIVKSDSKIARTVFVEEWKSVQQGTITETLQTKGVITPQEEYEIYLNQENKEFLHFLVKEGQAVTIGTPLVEYNVPNIDQALMEIEDSITQLDMEIEQMMDYIEKLKRYQSNVTVNDDESSTGDYIHSQITQDIYRQELEVGKLEERKAVLEEQQSMLQEQSGTLTLTSEYDGIVKEINKTLQNPLLTIVSNMPAVRGELSQEQREKVDVGMRFKIGSAAKEENGTGILETVHTYPTKEPKVSETPFYAFSGNIETEGKNNSEYLIGETVHVTIITNEVESALWTPSKAVFGKERPYVYLLTKKGRVYKKYINPGLAADGKQQVLDELQGNIVLVKPRGIEKNNSSFITPLQLNSLTKSSFKQLTKREKVRYFLIGMLEK